MRIDPSLHYDERYWSAKKDYRVVVGRCEDGSPLTEMRTYSGPALWWDGFAEIADAILSSLPSLPSSWLDIGCGAGCFVTYLRQRGVDAWGVDISPWAIGHAPFGVRPYVRVGDVTTPDWLDSEIGQRTFEAVSALDLVEHIYMADQPRLWDAFAARAAPGGYLVLDVASACGVSDLWEHDPALDVPVEREWQAVSGHVSVQTPDFWRGWARSRGWRRLGEAEMKFQEWRRSREGYRDMAAWDEGHFMAWQR